MGGVIAYIAAFVGVSATLDPAPRIETILIRATGTAALLLLHLVLIIGPLCRLNSKFLPLLYNRRHLGVTTFIVGLAHGVLTTIQFHTFGDVNPLVSILTANPRIDSISQFPFQPLGLAALVILFFMAATSHDFWLANLTAPVWKAMHMSVYIAYALLISHVSLGVLQAETHPLLVVTLGTGLLTVLGLHAAAGIRERSLDIEQDTIVEDHVDVCAVDDIAEKHAHIATIAGERVAVFKYDGKISCISNVCQHQNGPLGEGRIIDGYITCPWHGYQYEPDSGKAPAPFTECLPTFNLKIVDGRVHVNPKPNPPGTRVEPVAFAVSEPKIHGRSRDKT